MISENLVQGFLGNLQEFVDQQVLGSDQDRQLLDAAIAIKRRLEDGAGEDETWLAAAIEAAHNVLAKSIPLGLFEVCRDPARFVNLPVSVDLVITRLVDRVNPHLNIWWLTEDQERVVLLLVAQYFVSGLSRGVIL